MFLGANALFRRIRLQPSALGTDREEVNYRDVDDDPGYRTHPLGPTTSWRDGPHARPESALTGVVYECNPVNVDGVVADATSWVFAGTGLHDGDHLHLLVGTEYDRVMGAPRRRRTSRCCSIRRCGAAAGRASPTPRTTPRRAAPACSRPARAHGCASCSAVVRPTYRSHPTRSYRRSPRTCCGCSPRVRPPCIIPRAVAERPVYRRRMPRHEVGVAIPPKMVLNTRLHVIASPVMPRKLGAPA